MPDCDPVPIQPVRVYLKRLPSGVYRLTVLSPSLPRPVFRMYPAGTSEAEAVARAVGRALSTLENADCQLDEGNTASQGGTDNGSEKANGTRYLNRVAHDLPSPVPRCEQQHADEQRGADNDEASPVERVAHSGNEVGQHELPPPIDCDHEAAIQAKEDAKRDLIFSEVHRGSTDHDAATKETNALPTNCIKQLTQHRRPPAQVRVAWQGLL